MDPKMEMLRAVFARYDDRYVEPDIVLFVMDETVKAYERALPRVETHNPECICPTCEWVTPTRPAERWHGTPSGYRYRKCRCLRCKRAHRFYK